MSTPILYSFRRCPYAMRARLGIAASGQRVELREIVLRDKAPEFLAVSPSGTVPCLVNGAEVIDESLDVMTWALEKSDPEGWLEMPEQGWDWITRCDGPFKRALDRTKYETRYPECDPAEERAKAQEFLGELDTQIDGWIFGRPTLADFAILPFVRQFAFIDKSAFDAEDWPNLKPWLERFLASDRFAAIMTRHEKWQANDAPIYFP